MKKNELIVFVDYADNRLLTLQEICDICQTPTEFIDELIEYEIIQPMGKSREKWTFTVEHLIRTKQALRLNRDLEVNMSGIAIILDLISEIDKLNERLSVFDKYFSQE